MTWARHLQMKTMTHPKPGLGALILFRVSFKICSRGLKHAVRDVFLEFSNN